MVTFVRTSSGYRHAVLAKIGAQLLTLSMIGCHLIEVANDLKPCTELKRLVIRETCTMAPIDASVVKQSEPLLPNLVSLTSWICLGDSSPLFEIERPSLRRLTLYCPHINIPSVSKWNWCDVAKLWPRVDELRLYYTKGLRLENVRQMTTVMKNIISLTVPRAILVTEKEKLTSET